MSLHNAFTIKLYVGASLDLPSDFPDAFVRTHRLQDCCYVIRTGKRPVRCRQTRRGWNRTKPDQSPLCCFKHARHEVAAQAWREAQVRSPHER